ncbi:MAG: glutathione S-transferase N-terminal domain-containing protein [Bermanella sp.]|jgi:Glutaredoxin and related proteins
MKAVRAILGTLILFFDWLFTPRGIKRNAQQQASIDNQTASLALYQYQACPFCVKVRRAMKRRSLAIETKDAKRCDTSRDELLAGGGQLKVPCLRIEKKGQVSWMYESADIIRYLDAHFAISA